MRVTVVEASDRVGGKLLPGEIAGMKIDLGAESMLARRPEAVGLARAVGLADDLQPPETATASLWNRGALVPMPKGHVMGVPGTAESFAGVLSEEGLRRIERDAELPRTEIGDDVAVGEFVAERVGREVVDRLVEPLLGGVYAGDAYRISLRAAVPHLFAAAKKHASLTEAVRALQGNTPVSPQSGPVFMGIKGGVGRLPLAAAESLRARGVEILMSTPVKELRRVSAAEAADRTDDATPATDTGTDRTVWRVVTGENADRVLYADAVVMAAPARAAADLLRAEAPAAAAELDTVEYSSMALVAFAYRRSEAGIPEGSGFLVPPVDGHTVKAATFASNKWRWIADEDPDLLVVRTSVGRYGETEILGRSDEDLVAVSQHDLGEAIGVTAEPVATQVVRWNDGLPQYPVGHHNRVARIREDTGKLPGLVLCGAAYDGVGIPAVIASAYAAVDALDTSDTQDTPAG